MDLPGGTRGEWIPGDRDRRWAVVVAVVLVIAMVLMVNKIASDWAADNLMHAVNGYARIHLDEAAWYRFEPSPGGGQDASFTVQSEGVSYTCHFHVDDAGTRSDDTPTTCTR
jgi:hypothetical protein